MRGALRRFALLGFVLVLAAALGAFGWGVSAFNASGPHRADVTLVLPLGASVGDIARRLVAAGVIDNPLLFSLGARLSGHSRKLQAGEYRIAAGASAEDVMQLLVSGQTVVRRLTIPEGLTAVEIVSLLEATDGLAGAVDEAPDEGTLMPETYYFAYGDRTSDIIARMQLALTEALDAAWRERDHDLPLDDVLEALTLASIVEKETAVPEERPHIAGVFVNRLRRGMPLQSDPTVVYGLTGGRGALGRALTQADTKEPTPYNTYVISGLPPGPIGNPGRASIVAVMHPLVTEDLYFVADGTGGHAFARTLKEHLRNVAKWRRLQDDGE